MTTKENTGTAGYTEDTQTAGTIKTTGNTGNAGYTGNTEIAGSAGITGSREIWVDWLRVAACLMVLTVHSTEPFYLGGGGSLILTKSDALWAAFFDTLCRACVPLFLIVSGYLQFPLHYSAKEFFRKRAVRILPPFILWSLVYAFVWGDPVSNLKDLLLNFNYAAGHLWFVYMLIGVYLLMPLLSPWAERVSRRELLVYLGIWLLTTLIPQFRDWAGGTMPCAYGPTGIPNPARYPLWGEASWNAYGAFYYVSGMVGYLLLGLYFRRFAGEPGRRKTLLAGIPLIAAGFLIAGSGFLRRVFSDAGGVFPVGGDVSLAVGWETTFGYDSIGVALMTIGWIVLFRNIRGDGRFYRNVILPVSGAGYGVYLAHMLVLAFFSGLFRGALGVGADGVLGIWTTPVEIVATALCTFISVSALAVVIRKIPVVGKIVIG